MNEEALNTLYSLAKEEGYSKSFDEFKLLMSSNNEAINTMYNVSKNNGYTKTIDDFKVLVGNKKQQADSNPVKKKGSTKPSLQATKPSKNPWTDQDLTGGNDQKQKTTFTAPLKRESQNVTPKDPYSSNESDWKQKTTFTAPLKYDPEKERADADAKYFAENPPPMTLDQLKAKQAAAMPNGDPYAGTILAGNISDQFEKSQKEINSDLIEKNEEFVVPKLQYEYGQYGFKFEQTGMGDAMTVTAQNKKVLYVDLDPWSGSSSKESANELKKFLRENKTTDGANKAKQRVQSQDEVLRAVRVLNDQVKYFEDRVEKFSILKSKYEKQYEDEFKGVPPSEIQNNPELLDKLNVWSAEYQKIIDKGNNLNNIDKTLRYKGAKLDRLTGEYARMQSKQGTLFQGMTKEFMKNFAGSSAEMASETIDLVTYGSGLMGAPAGMSKEEYKRELIRVAKEENLIPEKYKGKGLNGYSLEKITSILGGDTNDAYSITKSLKDRALMMAKDMFGSPSVQDFINLDSEKTAFDIANSKVLDLVRKSIKYNKNYKDAVEGRQRNRYSYTADKTDVSLGIVDVTRTALADRFMDTFSDSDIPEAYLSLQQESTWSRALLGISGSLPSMIGGPGKVGGYIRKAKLFTSTANAMDKEMADNPEFDDVPESEKYLIKVPVALAVSRLEDIGFRNVISQKGLLNKYLAKAIGKSTASTTAKTFSEFIAQDVKSSFARGALTITAAGLAEFETGVEQELTESFLKELYNDVKGKDMFETPNTLTEWFSDALMAGVDEMIGGFIMGVPGAVKNAITKQKTNTLPDGVFETFEAIRNDPNFIEMHEAKLNIQVDEGEITREEADSELEITKKLIGQSRSIPTDYTTDQRKRALAIIYERDNLMDDIKVSDPKLVTKKQARVDQLNNQLESIIDEPKTAPQTSEVDIEKRRNEELALLDAKELGESTQELDKRLEEQEEINAKYDAELAALAPTSRAGINEENSSNFANLTEDADGNFVFFHRGKKGYDKVKKSSGTTKGSKGESIALGKIGGAAMYYTDQNDSEQMVTGNAQYSVKVAKDKVYDANSDPLGFREEAKAMHEEEFPGQSFDSNTELAYITKVAGNNGFEMVVGQWGGKTRAQTTSELAPNDSREFDGDVMTKDFSEKYIGNRDKGYEAVIPKSKFTNLKALYDKINDIRNKEALKGMEGRYDELYKLNSSFDKYTQEEITELIDKSDLSQEIKDEYKAIISEPTKTRSTYKGKTGTVKVDNIPKGTFLNIGLEIKGEKGLTEADIVAALPSDVKILNKAEIKKEGGKVDEDTMSLEISRELTDYEMARLRESTKQDGIPQISNGFGTMYGNMSAISKWGDFNPDYFVMPDGRKTSEYKAVETKSIKESASELSKKIRSLKAPIDLRNLSSSPKPIFDAAWNTTLEAIARAVEAGGTIAEAVAEGIKALKNSKWYDSLSNDGKKSAIQFAEKSLTDDASKLLKDKESSGPTSKERRNKIISGIESKIKSRNVGENTDPKKILKAAIAYFEGSKEYKEMDSTERESVYREIRKRFGAKEKSAPSAKRILGKLKDIKNITISEMVMLKKQIMDANRGAKDLKKAQNESKKQLISDLKLLDKKGEITTAQMMSVISRLEKVDLVDQNSVDSFIDYMADVFSDAEYRKKIARAKSMSSSAKKNIKTKLGQLTAIAGSLNKLFSINPKMIPLSVLDTYMKLVEAFGEKKAVLTVPEISSVKEQMSTIFDAIDEENSTAIVLADRFAQSEHKVFDKDGKLNFSESINKMIKEGDIEETEAKLMKKYKGFIVESESKPVMTEAEIKQEKDDLIKEIQSSPFLKISELSSRLERNLAGRFEKLLKSDNLNGLSNSDLKNIVKLIDNINNGYVNNFTQLMVEKLTSIGNEQNLKESILKAKILYVTGLYTKLKSKITKKGYILEMIRRNPLFYIDQIFGNYESTSMYDSVFKGVASGYANYKTQLTKILKRIDVAMDGVAKSFGRDINKTLKSSFLQQIYLIQLEHDSNVGNKEVNHAVEFVKKTIGKLDASTKTSKNIEGNILNEILNNKKLFNDEGNFDTKKIYDSFNSAEKKSIEILQEQSKLLQEKAIFTAAVIRGKTIIPRDNYVHLNVLSEGLEGEMSSPSEVSNYAKNIKPSTKGKSLIERGGGVSALNFNAYSAASKAAKYVLMDFNLTEPIRISRRTLSGTIKDLKGDKIRENTEELKIANAINSAFDEAVENVLITSYSETSIFDDVSDWIKKNGYRAVLASLPRAAAELSSNMAFALIANRSAFTTGAGLGVKFLTSDKAVNSMVNLNSTQTTKNYPNGGLDSRSVDITSKIDSNSKTLKARTGLGNVISKGYNKTVKRLQDSTGNLADKIISTPDKIVAVPLWFGEFSKSFEKATGLKPDFDKISENNEDYMNKYKSELDEATKNADKLSVMAGATNNPLSGILKGSSQNQANWKKVFNTFNNYMQTFLIFEYITARTGIYAVYTGGGVGRKKGGALIAASATRMVTYTLLSKMFADGMYSTIAYLFGWDDEEDEDEPTTGESLSNAILSSTTSMILGRDFGNVTKQLINYGVELANENYFEILRDGKDYNKYKHSLSYSLIPRDKDGKLSNDIIDYLIAGSGPMAPGIKAIEYAIKKTLEEDIEIDAEKQKENNKKKENIKKKISESNDAEEISALKLILDKIENDEESKLKKINRQKSEKGIRVPLDLLGVMGFIPLYKDVNKVYKKALYNGLSNEIKLSKEEKEKLKEDKVAEKEKLGKYDNKTDMKRYDPELYEETFGEESEFYDEEKLKKEIEKLKREIKTDIKDETFNYTPPGSKSLGGGN